MNFSSVLEKITIIWFERNKPNFKILLKDTYKPHNCGWLVKVSSISDGMLRNFIWSNAIDIDGTDAQICEPRTYEMRVITFHSDSGTAVSPTDRTLVGVKGPENAWLFEPSRLLETVKFL